MKKAGRPKGQFEREKTKLLLLMKEASENDQFVQTTKWLCEKSDKRPSQINRYLKALVSEGRITITTVPSVITKYRTWFTPRVITILPPPEEVPKAFLEGSLEKIAKQIRDEAAQKEASRRLFQSMDPNYQSMIAQKDELIKELEAEGISFEGVKLDGNLPS